uniref:Sulfotransferase domain-containing protein n=1 Tax=Pseudo-nitzschia delicatissima TaxID=44447 RepID=A0A7S0XQD1_9STRA|mmetsp:Transcript_2165/g.5106  ORF Transcript_2165/g.5106 Transcript_2165/m.5106 type:complete len:379 (+) Transcript_2165:73-1209(+)
MKTTKSSTKQWDKWGTKSYTVMPHVSPASKAIAENYRLRPTDVVVLSFPKTGTTWTQTVCEQLRTNAEGYEGFDDITERHPWLEFAHDCGQNLDDEIYGMPTNENPSPILHPRIFKSHQLLSVINPGAKYLCIVRDPASTLVSWFDFQKAKGRPGYAEYEDANEYIANRPELFSGNLIFGTNIWEMYEEVWSARHDPSVKTLVYEGLLADAANGYKDHFRVIEEFLGCSNQDRDESETEAFYEKVASLVSRSEMVKNVDKFDDHFIAEMGEKYGRALRIMEPAPKVREKKQRTELTEATIEWLEDQWFEKMTPKTGHTNYDEYATALSELLFEDEEEKTAVVPQEPVRTSKAMRRKSSLVLEQLPEIRRRRESLAPHE